MATKEKFPTLPTEGYFPVESFKAAGLTPLSAAETKRLKEESSVTESREEFEALVEREQTILRAFFGKDVDVPPVPASISLEQYEKWKELNYDLHYIPEEEMTEDKNYPGWKKKPDRGLNLFSVFKDKKNKMAPDTLKLKHGWVLVDRREKPSYANGVRAEYPGDDPLVHAIEELRAEGHIGGDNLQGSRFRIAQEELQKSEVKQKLAEIFEVNPDQIRLPRAIEQNFLANAHYPDWGDTNTYEWFEDLFQGSGHLIGGHSGSGGLSYVSWGSAGSRSGSLGFRPLIVFS
ncbi:MAG: hypothetical protein AAB590_02570 [Patescibacteria group bacterium]